MKKNINFTSPIVNIAIDDLKINDPIVYSDDKGYHVIGLSKVVSGDFKMVYLFTEDFVNFKHENINRNLIIAEKNNSIWAGCIFKDNNKFHVFYTVRSFEKEYWAKQTIKRLEIEKSEIEDFKTPDFKTLAFKNLNLTPQLADNDENIFQYTPNEDSYTIHSWRDPFVFKHNGKFYMLIAAKLNRKHFNASIALLVSDDLDNWTLVNPSIVPNNFEYEELELPSVFINSSNEIILMTCCWDRDDYIDTGKNGYNPLNDEKSNTDKIIRRKGMILFFKAENIGKAMLGQFKFDYKIETPHNFYGGCLIPDQNAIIGFDLKKQSMILLKHDVCKYIG